MAKITAANALKNLKRNTRRSWNRSPDSSSRSDEPEDASNRIFTGYADIRPTYSGPRFPAAAPVFTMGSCFAREIEYALRQRGGRVVSIDDTIDRDEFRGADGRVQTGFFHRYTPDAMLQEFRWPFGRQKRWSRDALIFADEAGGAIDLNYGDRAAMRTRTAVDVRREIAGTLVRTLAKARIIIVTLGLTESWSQQSTGLAVNAPNIALIRRRPDEFRLTYLDYGQVLAALEGIFDLVVRQHVDGDFQLFVTVSPVPLQVTFAPDDIVIANQTSKSTLRAAAVAFAAAHERAHYFPSYEMVGYSGPKSAWHPDRVHVRGAMTAHVMDRFIATVFEEGALPA